MECSITPKSGQTPKNGQTPDPKTVHKSPRVRHLVATSQPPPTVGFFQIHLVGIPRQNPRIECLLV